MFDSLRECRSHQSDQGGTISVIEQQQVKKTSSELGASFAYKNTGRAVFVLTKTETTKLCDGFRYIKELLIQLHNLAMQEAYDRLSRNGITVFSVKTDCFTIRPDGLEKANSCLDIFYPDPITGGVPAIGQWRVSKNKNIIFPTSSWQRAETGALSSNHGIHKSWIFQTNMTQMHICRLIEKHRRVMIRALCGGCGKS